MEGHHQQIISNYRAIINRISPSLTGGVLNFILEPANETDSEETTLRIATLELPKIASKAKEFFLTRSAPATILKTLYPTNGTDGLKNTAYMDQLITSVALLVASVIIVIVLLLYPFSSYRHKERKRRTQINKTENSSTNRTRRRRKESQKGNVPLSTKISYTVFAILGLAVITLQGLSCASLYYSIDGVVSLLQSDDAHGGSDKSSQPSGFPQLLSVVNSVINETRRFFDEVTKTAHEATKNAIHTMSDRLMAELKDRITDLKDIVLSKTHVRELTDLRRSLRPDLLNNEGDRIIAQIRGLNEHLIAFAINQTGLAKDIQNSLEKVCQQSAKNFSVCEMDIMNSLTINPEIQIKEAERLVDPLKKALNMPFVEMLRKFDGIMNDLNNAMSEITPEIKDRLDLNPILKPVSDVWDKVEKYGKTVNQELGGVKKIVNGVVPSAHAYFKIIAYIILVLLIALLVLVVYQFICCIVETLELIFAGHPSARMKALHSPFSWVSIVLSCAAALLPIIITVCIVIFFMATVISNEACRYVDNEEGVQIFDMSTNLLLKHEWRTFVSSEISRHQLTQYLNLSPPQFVLTALKKKCHNTDGSNVGLLPLVGINSLVNTSTVVNGSQINAAIKKNEESIVNKIISLKFDDYVSGDFQREYDQFFDALRDVQELDDNGTLQTLQELKRKEDEMNESLIEIRKSTEDFKEIDSAAAEGINIAVTLAQKNIITLEEYRQKATEALNELSVLWRNWSSPDIHDKLKNAFDNISNILSRKETMRIEVSEILDTQMDLLKRKMSVTIDEQSQLLVQNIIPCNRLYTITTSVLNVTCGQYGAITSVGIYVFVLGMDMLLLLLTILITRIFFSLHGHLYLNF
ncbi:unnamed protein product [Calicophoron daubneyi]|uniref:Uncharacterized protein n=1 Tax=Calicophoron daubneyi TaxID=300641 RepID=A0AAV2TN50_CALDB